MFHASRLVAFMLSKDKNDHNNNRKETIISCNASTATQIVCLVATLNDVLSTEKKSDGLENAIGGTTYFYRCFYR